MNRNLYKRVKYLIGTFCSILVSLTYINAQEQNYGIQMISRAAEDSIMLRWAPTNYESWVFGNKNGYIVERYTNYKDGNPYPDRRPLSLTNSPLKSISVEAWESMSEHNDYAGIAAQAIYGESFDVEAEDDSPAISIFNRASVQQNRYSFALFAADYSAEVARGMGLMFTDKEVVDGEKYLYVVYFANQDTLQIDTAFSFTGTDEVFPLKRPIISQAIGEDKTVTLEWMSPQGRSGYTSFEVERSNDGGKTFKRRNTSPLINTVEESSDETYKFFIDTLPQNNIAYVYRVRGINPFGEKGPYSDTMSVKGVEGIKDMPHIIVYEPLEGLVHLEWEFNKKAEKLIKGFQVFRSTKSNQGFMPVSEILSQKERIFDDQNPIPTAYYKVFAVGKNGSMVSSFPVLAQGIDSIPPVEPTGLNATIDTTGKVFLQWKANADEDIYGYRIYRANASHEEFSQITVAPVRDTFFLDQIKLKTLSSTICYKVMAIDKRQNHSGLSEILEVARPDVIPPVSPIVKNIYSSTNGICLEWVPSSSSDVVSEVILRKADGQENWEQIYSIKDTLTFYCDTTIKEGQIYSYTLAAIDDNGLQSEVARIVSGRKQRNKQTIELSFEIKRSDGYIELNWTPINSDATYILYRSVGEEPMMTYTRIDGNGGIFTDKKVVPDSHYRYMLKSMVGKKIMLSNVVEIEY